MSTLLRVQDLKVSYGKIDAVLGVGLAMDEGSVVSIVGPNGAGKSSLLNALVGSVPSTGAVEYAGRRVDGWLIEERVEHGLCLVPERRELFGDLSVADNLDLGAFRYRGSKDPETTRTRDWLLTVFPRLKERLDQKAGTLSGGEQQMLALSRALMSRPRLLLLDEPSLGLAPLIVREIFKVIVSLRDHDMSVLVVEQNARIALESSDYCYVMEGGRFALQGPASELAQDPQVVATYLGTSTVKQGA
ncbi:ABC transporter ATP-binding protein [Pusillimonas caeni]|uniref:ABC transporter ATP-binding protein n=1 Tax=Pusillimonas caeni TaxID=1348472 RepID=UPI000E59D724|nr:ABC transporter ATP-binding protein [Pusillimonas caeni]TFL14871.1 ABC transporter ATP-binding protein [Pusillimonas caeni]